MNEKETLGSYLKNQRESQKISLREVAKNTRVREHILRAIEEDQYRLLPPATYVKGFLLAYAKYLRLDPNDVLLRYERVLKGALFTAPSAQPLRPKQEISPFPPSKSKQKIPWNSRQTWVVAGVLVASFIIFYFFSPYSSKPPIEPVREKPVVEPTPLIAPSPAGTATVRAPEGKPAPEGKKPLPSSPPITETTTVQEKKPLSLQLKAVEVTWVSLQVDEQPEKEMTFQPGEGFSVQASNRIHMILGNAGGLDVVLNGKPLEKFGRSGEVVTLSFTPQGAEVRRHARPKTQ